MTAHESWPPAFAGVLSHHGAIDLVGRTGSPRRRPSRPRLGLRRAFQTRLAEGDHAGALVAAELRLGADPEDLAAQQCADECRRRLEGQYEALIGPLDSVFNLRVSQGKLRFWGLESEAAELVRWVDGQTTVAEVLELSGRPRGEALRAFAELIESQAIVRVA